MFFLILGLFALLYLFLALRRFDIALALLFFSLPAYLIRFYIGPLPSTALEVMVWILSIAWCVKNRSHIRHHITRVMRAHPSLCIAALLFLAGATISIFTAVDIRAALGEWKAFYLEPAALFFIVAVAISKEQRGNEKQTTSALDSIFLTLILSGLATSLLAMYQRATGWMVPYSFWENRNTYRVTAWYGYPNAVGLFLAPLVPLALYQGRKLISLYRSKKWGMGKRNMAALVTVPLFLLSSIPAIIFAKSTGALIGVAAGVGVLLLSSKKTRWPALMLGGAGVVALILMPDNAIRQEILMQDRSGQLRRDIWAETAEFLIRHPIAGAGLASYSERIAPYRIDKTIEIFHLPHNLFLTIWVNTGLIGLVGFLWVIVWFYRVALFSLLAEARARRTSGDGGRKPAAAPAIFLVASMTTLLVTGLVDSPYAKNDLSILFWLLPAALLGLSLREGEATPEIPTFETSSRA